MGFPSGFFIKDVPYDSLIFPFRLDQAATDPHEAPFHPPQLADEVSVKIEETKTNSLVQLEDRDTPRDVIKNSLTTREQIDRWKQTNWCRKPCQDPNVSDEWQIPAEDMSATAFNLTKAVRGYGYAVALTVSRGCISPVINT